MKRLRLLLAVSILTMTLATVTAIAGQMPGGVTSPPPLPPVEASATSDIPNGVASTSTLIDPLTEFTLNLLRRVLSVF